MTARIVRRISQPDSRCVPSRNAVLNKKNVVALPPLPLAQLHPRKHCRETSAARIRKAGRVLTAPLPQLLPWLFSTKNGVDAPLPLAQLHPRNALPRVSLAARIRKAGRCLTAPLARRHSAQVLGVSASASCRAHAHAQKLIHGSAIKSRANRRRFSDLQSAVKGV
jgi:hypothetical protein